MVAKRFTLGLSLLASLLLAACASSQGATSHSRDMQLIRASERGQTQEMYRLIRAGADINAQDADGWTPYLAASSMGHFEAMRILRALGARTDAPEMDPTSTARYIPR